MTEKLRRDRKAALDAEASSPGRPMIDLAPEDSGVVLGADVGFRPPSLANSVTPSEGRR